MCQLPHGARQRRASELEFISYLAKLIEKHPLFDDTRVEAPIKSSRYRADITTRRRTGGKRQTVLVECKTFSFLNRRRVQEAVAQIRRFREAAGFDIYALAFPGRLSKVGASEFKTAGIDIWDVDFIAEQFEEQIREHPHPYFSTLFLGVLRAPDPPIHKGLLERLAVCAPGKEHWVEYQKLVGQTLQHLFCPPLASPISEWGDAIAVNRRDWIFPNYADSGFWHFLRQTYKADLAAVPAITKFAKVQAEQISNVASSDMTPDIWLRIAVRVNELLAKPEIAGVVVTHGTSTLEETAYFLDLTVTGQKPVILVGAQRPASDPDADGPRNLLDAVRVAVEPEAAGKGAMIVMNGQINAARDVTKSNTSQVETFRSLELGALGTVDVEKVRFYRTPLRRQTIPIDSRTQLGRVDIVMNYAGADGLLVRSLVRDKAVQGLVIAGLGLGSVTGPMFEAIQEVRAQGIPVVISTRVPTGRVFPLPANKGSALALRQIGCILADNLSPQKARILLMLGLTKTRDPEMLRKYFDN